MQATPDQQISLTDPDARSMANLTAVVDVASRCVLAPKVAITLEAIHAREVIEQAFARYGAPEIVNIGQGSQFTAVEFLEVVHERGQAVHGRARCLA